MTTTRVTITTRPRIPGETWTVFVDDGGDPFPVGVITRHDDGSYTAPSRTPNLRIGGSSRPSVCRKVATEFLADYWPGITIEFR